MKKRKKVFFLEAPIKEEPKKRIRSLKMGDKVLYQSIGLLDLTEVVVISGDQAQLRNGVTVLTKYSKVDRVLTEYPSKKYESRILLWGDEAEDVWKRYHIKLSLNNLQKIISKVEINKFTREEAEEIGNQVTTLLNKLENANS